MIAHIAKLALALTKAVPAELADNTNYLLTVQDAFAHTGIIRRWLEQAWSVEYALRITPMVTDTTDIKQIVGYTFPQVYFSVHYSAKAFLIAIGEAETDSTLSEHFVTERVSELYDFYPACLFADGPYFDTVGLFRITGQNMLDMKKRALAMSADELRQFHSSLVTMVSQINLVHEAYIVRALGAAAYKQLMAGMPGHLQDTFVQERFVQIMALEAELQAA